MTKTGRNEPSMEPIVDNPYTRPATDPASEALDVRSLIAKGDVQPSNVIGTAKISMVPANAPATKGAFRDARAVAAYSNIGLDMTGINAVVMDAQQISVKYFVALGVLSANCPPM